jgi:SAM-dependent methyltransferase
MDWTNRFSKLKRWAHQRHGPQPLGRSMEAMRGWETSPLGKALFKQQQEQLDDLLAELFGYHLLEMSSFDHPHISAASRINHRFKLSPVADFGGRALCELDALPLADESIDVVLLHHVLEYATNPHQILREANRVLISRGHLIIIGFQPWSLQGGYKLVAQWLSAGSVWRRSSLQASRIKDWLRLLDCEPVALMSGFHRLPVNHAGLLEKFSFWERLCHKLKSPFGGYYILLARKDVIAMTPIKPAWSKFNPVAGLVMGKPTPRMPEAAGQRSQCQRRRPEAHPLGPYRLPAKKTDSHRADERAKIPLKSICPTDSVSSKQ